MAASSSPSAGCSEIRRSERERERVSACDSVQAWRLGTLHAAPLQEQAGVGLAERPEHHAAKPLSREPTGD